MVADPGHRSMRVAHCASSFLAHGFTATIIISVAVVVSVSFTSASVVVPVL
jgi:hypothetical protein